MGAGISSMGAGATGSSDAGVSRRGLRGRFGGWAVPSVTMGEIFGESVAVAAGVFSSGTATVAAGGA